MLLGQIVGAGSHKRVLAAIAAVWGPGLGLGVVVQHWQGPPLAQERQPQGLVGGVAWA